MKAIWTGRLAALATIAVVIGFFGWMFSERSPVMEKKPIKLLGPLWEATYDDQYDRVKGYPVRPLAFTEHQRRCLKTAERIYVGSLIGSADGRGPDIRFHGKIILDCAEVIDLKTRAKLIQIVLDGNDGTGKFPPEGTYWTLAVRVVSPSGVVDLHIDERVAFVYDEKSLTYFPMKPNVVRFFDSLSAGLIFHDKKRR